MKLCLALLLASVEASEVDNLLKTLRFKNEAGVVKSQDVYELRSIHSIYNEQYSYRGNGSYEYHANQYVNYLFKQTSDGTATPPNGMRSSVPLGPLGQGSLELRADGTFMDWRGIFNNNIYTPEKHWAQKMDVDDAVLGFKIQGTSSLIRTHPPLSGSALPVVESLSYTGAFPVSKLQVESKSAGPVLISVYAYSSFKVHDVAKSTIPMIYLSVLFKNTDPDKRVNSTLFFNMPNVIGGSWTSNDDSITLNKVLGVSLMDRVTSGNFTVGVTGADRVDFMTASSLEKTWAMFESGSFAFNDGQHGAMASRIELAPGEERTMTIGLSWFFPIDLWGSTDIGHNYANNFGSSVDVFDTQKHRVDEVLSDIHEWQTTCFNNSLETRLQDALVNSPSFWGKTALFTKDGRWRQFESHSCAQMEPPHIHLPRMLGYKLFFSDLERQTLDLYSKQLNPGTGMLGELFGGSCTIKPTINTPSDLDKGAGGARADDNPAFVIDVYMNYLMDKDGLQLLHHKWVQAKLALVFILKNAPSPFHLTYRLVNTNDEHGLIGDIGSYNSFFYLTSLAAGVEMAKLMGDDTFANEMQVKLDIGKTSLHEKFWNEDEGYYGQAWCDKNAAPAASKALQSDVLFGLLWANVLGLASKVGIPENRLRDHLMNERKRNITPYGLTFTTNRIASVYQGRCMPDRSEEPKADFVDEDVWNAHSMSHAALSIYTRAGTTSDAMNVAGLVLDAYRVKMNDQWDYRDTTTAYDDSVVPKKVDPLGLWRPSVNSHYGRQTIFWAIPLALTGQVFDDKNNALHLNPHPSFFESQENSWPVFTPTATLIMRQQKNHVFINLLVGSLDLSSIQVVSSFLGSSISATKDELVFTMSNDDTSEIM